MKDLTNITVKNNSEYRMCGEEVDILCKYLTLSKARYDIQMAEYSEPRKITNAYIWSVIGFFDKIEGSNFFVLVLIFNARTKVEVLILVPKFCSDFRLIFIFFWCSHGFWTTRKRFLFNDVLSSKRLLHHKQCFLE